MAGSSMEVDLLMEECEDMPDLVDMLPDGGKLPSLIDQNTEGLAPKDPEEFVSVNRKRKRGKEGKDGEDVEMEEGEKGGRKKEKGGKPESEKGEKRKIPVPPHRYAPLKEKWVQIFTPCVKQLGLQIRYNMKARNVELRLPRGESDTTKLQKGADFVKAIVLGFEVDDALALVRLDHLFLESFEVADVKFSLKGEHVGRAIGRIAGKDGRTKLIVENTCKCRIVIADTKIHLLGSYQNMRVARHAICSLILGSPPSKVYGNLRNLANRTMERM
ncbi:hypothetical protein PMAYCL1PPCAC_06951 [Pristionchus mayeri]|uniref:PNO1 second type I KH domain-containing protein n=1 Tax=Pristionchus mayeri TaxID=1317129 RepID=A0AAN5CCU7_9BILA|nr:hypothetical protein PMAYCL1PPCAC_06951 [Pristionchus mayeri]